MSNEAATIATTVNTNTQHPLPSEPALYKDRKRVALITGGGRGIGLAIALRLAKDGLDIAISDINAASLESAAKELEALGARTSTVVGDVSNPEDVANMVDKTVSDLGYLDVMVANAGIELVKPLLETTAAEFDRIFAVNVRGVFLSYKYAGQHFIKQGTGGKLIAASSMTGIQAEPLLSAYSSTKFAIRGINQAAAAELAPYGITANCYAPGMIVTSMAQRIGDAAVDRGVQAADNFLRSTVLGRAGVPEDVANIASFLASRDSDYVTGQAIRVDGGIRLS